MSESKNNHIITLFETVAYAYELGEVRVYQKPKDLIEFGCNRAPQSFAYAKPRRN